MWMSVSPFPKPLLSCLVDSWSEWLSAAAKRKVNNMTFTHQDQFGFSQRWEPTAKMNNRTTPNTGSLPLRKGKQFLLTRTDSAYGSSSLSLVFLSKPPSMNLENALFLIMVLHTTLLWPGNLAYRQLEHSRGHMVMELTGLCPPSSSSSWPERAVEW